MTRRLTCIEPRSGRSRRGYVRRGDLVRVEWPAGVAWVRVAEAWQRILDRAGTELGIVVGKTTMGRWMIARLWCDGVRVTDHRPETDEAVRASFIASMRRELAAVRWPRGTMDGRVG